MVQPIIKIHSNRGLLICSVFCGRNFSRPIFLKFLLLLPINSYISHINPDSFGKWQDYISFNFFKYALKSFTYVAEALTPLLRLDAFSWIVARDSHEKNSQQHFQNNYCTPHICLTSLVGLYKSWWTGPDLPAERLKGRGFRNLQAKSAPYIANEIFSAVHQFFHQFKINNTLFSVLNLRTYSKKLIAAIVLHTLPAFCSCKCINNVTKWYIVKQGRKRLEENGSNHNLKISIALLES